MIRVFQIFIFFLLFSFGATEILSCTCVNSSLSKRFKESEAVFIGKIAENTPENDSEIQNMKEGLPVLEVIKSWKGVKKKYIAVDFDFSNYSGSCSALLRFEEDKEYLVFAYSKDLKVEVECSDTRPLKAESNYTTREISKLNNFWFRFWARIKPF